MPEVAVSVRLRATWSADARGERTGAVSQKASPRAVHGAEMAIVSTGGRRELAGKEVPRSFAPSPRGPTSSHQWTPLLPSSRCGTGLKEASPGFVGLGGCHQALPHVTSAPRFHLFSGFSSDLTRRPVTLESAQFAYRLRTAAGLSTEVSRPAVSSGGMVGGPSGAGESR
jgi:hypothetical protein